MAIAKKYAFFGDILEFTVKVSDNKYTKILTVIAPNVTKDPIQQRGLFFDTPQEVLNGTVKFCNEQIAEHENEIKLLRSKIEHLSILSKIGFRYNDDLKELTDAYYKEKMARLKLKAA